MLNQTEHIIKKVSKGHTMIDTGFAKKLKEIPELQMYSENGIWLWSAWDFVGQHRSAYSIDRMLCDIAIEAYNRQFK